MKIRNLVFCLAIAASTSYAVAGPAYPGPIGRSHIAGPAYPGPIGRSHLAGPAYPGPIGR
jgi:hypothetical protein